MPDVVQVNVATGERIERDFTDEERAAHEQMEKEWAARRKEQEAAAVAEQAARESALAKLAALGLTAEEAAAIIG